MSGFCFSFHLAKQGKKRGKKIRNLLRQRHKKRCKKTQVASPHLLYEVVKT